MSHFTCLVIGDNIEAQLQPFHEYECTGIDDQYVVEITDEDGTKRRTNPNAKWDWWLVGGRWSGFLKLKPGASGELGERGVMGSHFAEGPLRADAARKGDIDFDGMRDEAGAEALELWNKANALTGGVTWESWESVCGRIKDIDKAREHYHAQPAIVALKKDDRLFGWHIDDSLAGPAAAFVRAARERACSTYAVVRNGEWSEKGSMGWWGISTGDMPQAKWDELISAMLDGLPDDTMITVVDCHI